VPFETEANPRMKQRAAFPFALLAVDFAVLSLHCNALAIAPWVSGVPQK
jgi:hypothetical protein